MPESSFTDTGIGRVNAEIINNLIVCTIENSYGKPYISMDHSHYKAINAAKRENYEKIYGNAATLADLDATVKPMMTELYDQLLEDLQHNNTLSPVFTHHINYVNQTHYRRDTPYELSDPNDLVMDYIASMTDSYFVEAHHYLFPNSPLRVKYVSFFP